MFQNEILLKLNIKQILVTIVNKYFLPNIAKNEIIELVLKSNHNLHNIIVNIDFYKTKFTQINTYDNVNDELL